MSAFETGNKLRRGPDGQELTRTSLTTRSMKVLDLADPKPEQVCIEDIAHGLSQHVRWAGQGAWMSVAQHSVCVMRMIEQWGPKWHHPHSERTLRMALMHDAHEAYIGDLSGGLKYLLRDSDLKELILKLDLVIEYAIPKLDLDCLGGEKEALEWAEEVLVPLEYNLLFKGQSCPEIEGPLCQRLSEELFMQEAERLGMTG